MRKPSRGKIGAPPFHPKLPKGDAPLHDLVALAKRMSMPKAEYRFEEEKNLNLSKYELKQIENEV